MLPNVGETIAGLKTFAVFCLEHPWLSLPIAAGLLVFAGAGAYKVVKEVRAEILWVWQALRRGPARKRALVAGGALLLGASAWGVSAIARYEVRPRPVVERVSRRIIRPDFTVGWSYEATGDPADVRFLVSVRNRRTNEIVQERNTTLRNLQIGTQVSGPLTISVRAIEGGRMGPPSRPVDVDYFQDSRDRILSTGQIVAAVHTDRSDGLFCYESGDAYEGFDIDLLEAVARVLTHRYRELKLYAETAPPLSVRAVRFGWPEILDEPGRMEAVDLAIASISFTEQREREKRIYFSKPYWRTSLAVVQSGKITSPFDLAEFRGKRIGVHLDTTALAFIKELPGTFTGSSEIVTAVSNADLFARLRNHQIDLALYDYDRSIPETIANPGWTVRKIDKGQTEKYGMIFSRINTRLRDDINQALDDLGPGIQKMMDRRLDKMRAARPGQARSPSELSPPARVHAATAATPPAPSGP